MIDVIEHGERKSQQSCKSSPRRCGGLGDVLSGVIAALLSMSNINYLASDEEEVIFLLKASCFLVRKSSALAFDLKSRAMSALDVVSFLSRVFDEM